MFRDPRFFTEALRPCRKSIRSVFATILTQFTKVTRPTEENDL